MYFNSISPRESGLTDEEIRAHVKMLLDGREAFRCLIIPPDYSRYFSNAGLITNYLYHELEEKGCKTDIIPALGMHEPMTDDEISHMFGDIPRDRFFVHNWRQDTVRLGEVKGSLIEEWSEGVWNEDVAVEVNYKLMSPEYDLVISVGQVVPHEVVGMSNYSKNIFVGLGGSNMINMSHMIGGLYGLERIMGRTDSPVRKLYDYSLEQFLKERNIIFMMTVCNAEGGRIQTHGIFTGDERTAYEEAAALALKKNIFMLDKPVKKCVVYLNPSEYKSTWIGNKAIYRSRMAIADGGELLILAPGIKRFGEDPEIDALIRKYGYPGRENVLRLFRQEGHADMRQNMGGTAHLIHGSSDGRFTITYAVRDITKEEIRSVGFQAADYDEVSRVYDPDKLKPGFQTVNGEEIFYIENPMTGLWFEKSRI